jgi:hypothetical protein
MTGSFIGRCISDVRRYTEEPVANAKYTDDVLINMIEQAYAHIINEVNRCNPEPVVARFSVTCVADTTEYILPPITGPIWAVYTETDSGYKIFYDSRSQLNPCGRRVWIERNILHVQSGVLEAGASLIVEYVPSGTARLHTGTCTVDSTGKIITLGATPTDGTLDTRAHAYIGSVIRIISDTDADYNYIQERIISAYTNTTRAATTLLALSPNQGDGIHSGTTSYEIAPAIHQGLDHAVAMYLARWIVSIEGSTTRARLLNREFQDVIRNLRLTAYYSNLMEVQKARADNYDNRRFSRSQLYM